VIDLLGSAKEQPGPEVASARRLTSAGDLYPNFRQELRFQSAERG
jgi:hypothetical protein